jgi:HEAT repeat protein
MSFVGVATVAMATPVPQFRVADIVKDSDVIAIGVVVSVANLGPTSIVTPNGAISGRQMVATLVTDQMIKGPGKSSLQFEFAVPDAAIGYGGVEAGDVRMFFLKGRGEPYQLVSPHYPSLVAVRGIRLTARGELERVVEALGAVVTSSAEPEAARQSAIYALWGTKIRFGTDALASALADATPATRLTAAAALLAGGDMRALQVAEDALTAPNPNATSEVLHNLAVAISEGIRDPGAVPALARLLLSPNVGARRSAAVALRAIGSSTAVEALVKALDDVDSEVQYTAVTALAEITGQRESAPSLPAFLNNQQHYVEHWKAWKRNARRFP